MRNRRRAYRRAIGALIAAIELFPLNLYAPLFVFALSHGERWQRRRREDLIRFFLFLTDARIGTIAFRLLFSFSLSLWLGSRSIHVTDFWIKQIRRIFQRGTKTASKGNEVFSEKEKGKRRIDPGARAAVCGCLA